MDCNLIVLLGPTASGKTRVAVRLAREFGLEIISADSRQVYRGLDIGTGKDLGEYVADGRPVPYHLIDIVNPAEEFSVFDYQSRFHSLFLSLQARGVLPILAGGSGLYLDAVIRGYRMTAVPVNPALRRELEVMASEDLECRLRSLRPSFHNTTDFKDRNRAIRAIEIAEACARTGREDVPPPDIRPFIVGIRWDRGTIRQRIAGRLEQRIRAGMVDEVRRLYETGLSWQRMESLGLEYRYVSRYQRGEMSYPDMLQTLNLQIGRFAKRQITWFRKMERQGAVIHWIEGDDHETAKGLVRSVLKSSHTIDSPR